MRVHVFVHSMLRIFALTCVQVYLSYRFFATTCHKELCECSEKELSKQASDHAAAALVAAGIVTSVSATVVAMMLLLLEMIPAILVQVRAIDSVKLVG